MKHKTEDYKISAVKYYLKNTDSFSKTYFTIYCLKLIKQKMTKKHRVV